MKKKIILIPLLFASLLTGCIKYNGEGLPNPNPGPDIDVDDSLITSITASVDSLEFNKGGLPKTVTVTLETSGEVDLTLAMVCDNTSVARLGEGQTNGIGTSGTPFEVIPVAPGNTQLVISAAEDATKTVIIPITVSDVPAIIPVTEVSLNKTSLELTVGSSETLIHTVKPDNATNKTVTWSSSDPTVATVDQNGNVNAVSKGTARITVTAQDGLKTQTCEVTVKNSTVITAGYYLVGSMTSWSKSNDYKMETNPGNPDEVMITWLGHMGDEVKVVYHPTAGEDTWAEINAGESGANNGCATISGSNWVLAANATYTLYFKISAIDGTYKYWFTSSIN